MEQFFVARTGSVIGREHRRLGLPNQDAYLVHQDPQLTVAVVCDGCGSTPHAEVGAKLTARLVVDLVREQWQRRSRSSVSRFFQHRWLSLARLQQDLLLRLDTIVDVLGGERLQTVHDYLLCTILVSVVTPDETIIFGLGDGIFTLNGDVIVLTANAGNTPSYAAYGLLNPEQISLPPEKLRFRLYRRLPTSRLESVIIATDGTADWLIAAGITIPGTTKPIEPFRALWENDWYSRNPDALRRTLTMINRDAVLPDWDEQLIRADHGRFADDTTIVLIKPQETNDANASTSDLHA